MAVTAAELRRLRPYTIIEVCWEDACFNEGDGTISSASDVHPSIRYSLGYVVRSDKDYVIICAGDDRKADRKDFAGRGVDRPIFDVLTLPTSLVRDIRVLERPSRR